MRGQGNGGTATAVWAPAEPTLAVETDLADFDAFEVCVYDTSRDQRLVAAVELISPGNKDRPQQRSQFTAKCASLLRNGVSLVLVDVVTEHCFNLYADLLDLIGQSDPSLGASLPQPMPWPVAGGRAARAAGLRRGTVN